MTYLDLASILSKIKPRTKAGLKNSQAERDIRVVIDWLKTQEGEVEI